MKSIVLLLATASYAAGITHCSAEEGQRLLDEGRYEPAVREFSCLIDAQPASVDGYRGRIEAKLLLGEYAGALSDYSKVTAFVLPANPDAAQVIEAGYARRLAANRNSVPALTGASFFQWWAFDYAKAIQLLNRLLEVEPRSRYGNLFLGSSRLLKGANRQQGVASLELAIQLDPANPHVRFVAADAYTYGLPDPTRAFDEARLALRWGLDTPRIHAILANSYRASGSGVEAAAETLIHIQQVTSSLVGTDPLLANSTRTLPLIPGRTYEIPVSLTAGQVLDVSTSSGDFYDTILVVLNPKGQPVASSDDDNKYFAAVKWTAGSSGIHLVRVTSFEGINMGGLVVRRGD